MSMQNNLKTKIFLDGGIPDETKGEKCTEEDGWNTLISK